MLSSHLTYGRNHNYLKGGDSTNTRGKEIRKEGIKCLRNYEAKMVRIRRATVVTGKMPRKGEKTWRGSTKFEVERRIGEIQIGGEILLGGGEPLRKPWD